MIERNVGFASLKLTPFETPFGIEGLKLSNQIPQGERRMLKVQQYSYIRTERIGFMGKRSNSYQVRQDIAKIR